MQIVCYLPHEAIVSDGFERMFVSMVYRTEDDIAYAIGPNGQRLFAFDDGAGIWFVGYDGEDPTPEKIRAYCGARKGDDFRLMGGLAN